MPLNDERPTSTSSGEDQGSDVESSTERCDSDCSRKSFASDGSSKNSTPSSSPPINLTMDEIMGSAKDLSNLSLAHEIIVNHDFHMEPPKLPQNSLAKRVADAVHRASWEILESELNGDPPKYEHAIKLLEEIRGILLSFLNPGANRMRTQITEVLDMELIRLQADNDAVDIQGMVSYIITTMGKLCAPDRDKEIMKLREITGNVPTLFREIFRVLDLMNMDMINVTIQILRPELRKQSVKYERATFQSILDKTPNALDITTSWIKAALEEVQLSMQHTDQTGSRGKGQKALPGPFLVVGTAFVHVLSWDHTKSPPPETLMTDERRLTEIRWRLRQLQAVNAVLLIVYSTVGGPVQGLASLAERLKRMTCVLLDGINSPDFDLEEALRSAGAQICCELNKSLTERNYPALTPALQATLAGQMCSIVQTDNPIRTLVEERVRQYFLALLTAQQPLAKLEQVPAGLAAIKPELMSLGAKLRGLMDFNWNVYGPFYAGILKNLMFGDSPPTPASPQDDAQCPLPSS